MKDALLLVIKAVAPSIQPSNPADSPDVRDMWNKAKPHERERMLKRANMPFEDYLASEAGRDYIGPDGETRKIGQLPHQDTQVLCDMWTKSVEHANKLGVPLPDPVKESWRNVKMGRNMGMYRDHLVNAYADSQAETLRRMGGLNKKKKL